MLEKSIIRHCSPTLAGLKTANMFSYKFENLDQLQKEIQEQNGKLNEKGVFVEVLRHGDSKALIYVYRKKKLLNDLNQKAAGEILDACGYDKNCQEIYGESDQGKNVEIDKWRQVESCQASMQNRCSMDCEHCLNCLKKRFAKREEFPHEVGLFLGYPLEDVVGFIEQKGKNYKYSGPWKVYGDVSETKKAFRRYEKCSEVYGRLFEAGRPITKLTVAA